ncbi:unnamed protein product [Caenorhabditis angaria]|uniref:Uncharacterized protein n=1 Tax=Caenorhabditis angaria TaxID=860376 RepID=A0A9P1IHU6_9PELO|nr:unnamed protein product [Caenorhabditis angaria]
MILYSDQGVYTVIPPTICGLEVKIFAICLLLLDTFGFLTFWCNSNGVLAYIFAVLMILNLGPLGFVLVYWKQKFPAIFMHFMETLLYLILVAIVFAFVEFDVHVCPHNRCQRISEMLEIYGEKINYGWFYTFCIFTVITHCSMLLCSWKLMKFAAAKTELRKISRDMERRRLNDIL